VRDFRVRSGSFGEVNVQGEEQQKLDVIANKALMRCLGTRASVAVLASEEDDEPSILRRGNEGGKYCVLFDPLDGSSNLDTGVGVGTIFSILRNDPSIPDAQDDGVPAGYAASRGGLCSVRVVDDLRADHRQRRCALRT
jgi:fructose-1,6-bisphosphatase